MNKKILQNIENRLTSISELKYIDENWGQLNFYTSLSYPSVLIDISEATFSDAGINPSLKPENRQISDLTITITLALLKSKDKNSSVSQMENEKWSVWEILEKIHSKLHGINIDPKVNKLMRKSLKKIKRIDGIQEYEIVYTTSVINS